MFDLLVKDAKIFDGSGASPVHGELAVNDGRIAAIGSYRSTSSRAKAIGPMPAKSKVGALHSINSTDRIPETRREWSNHAFSLFMNYRSTP